MDLNLVIGALQLVLSGFQIKLDHFSKKSSEFPQEEKEKIFKLGEAIRSVEFALSETVDYIGRRTENIPNPKLSKLWREASESLRNVDNSLNLTDIAFEKHHFWTNPKFYENSDERKLYTISVENILIQLRKLRLQYEKLRKKIDAQE